MYVEKVFCHNIEDETDYGAINALNQKKMEYQNRVGVLRGALGTMQPITAGTVASAAYQGAQRVTTETANIHIQQLNQWNNDTQFTSHVGDAVYKGVGQVQEWDNQYQLRQHAADTAYAGIFRH